MVPSFHSSPPFLGHGVLQPARNVLTAPNCTAETPSQLRFSSCAGQSFVVEPPRFPASPFIVWPPEPTYNRCSKPAGLPTPPKAEVNDSDDGESDPSRDAVEAALWGPWLELAQQSIHPWQYRQLYNEVDSRLQILLSRHAPVDTANYWRDGANQILATLYTRAYAVGAPDLHQQADLLAALCARGHYLLWTQSSSDGSRQRPFSLFRTVP